jgi:hypothetical protein
MPDKPNDSLKEPNAPKDISSTEKLLRRSSTVSRFKKKVNTSLHTDEKHTRGVNESSLADTMTIEAHPPPPIAVTKDERAEKLRKKAKNFLDERQKTKARAQSLWSFIGTMTN